MSRRGAHIEESLGDCDTVDLHLASASNGRCICSFRSFDRSSRSLLSSLCSLCSFNFLPLASHEKAVVVALLHQRMVIDMADRLAVIEANPVPGPGETVGHSDLAAATSGITRDVFYEPYLGASHEGVCLELRSRRHKHTR